MNLKRSIRTWTLAVSAFSILVPVVLAQSNSKGKDSRVVVGTLKRVDATGTKFDVLQSGEHLRELHVNAKSVIQFVGLPAEGEQKPKVGTQRSLLQMEWLLALDWMWFSREALCM